MKRTHIIAAAGAAAFLALGWIAGQATAAQPHMEAALDDLKAARSELMAATHNKGGHRAEALRLVNAAIAETRTGMNVADD